MDGTSARRSWDHATIVFWVLSAAFAVGLFVAYRHSWWFMFDDLAMFGSRLEAYEQHGLADLLLRRHFEHLMAGTIAWNLVLGKLFGLMSYTPWMATIVVAMVGAAVQSGTPCTRSACHACSPLRPRRCCWSGGRSAA